MQPLYVFIDEGGDFNFSPKGSRFYSMTAVITHCPWEYLDEIYALKHRILSKEIHSHVGMDYLENCLCHKFHCTEDKQCIRNDFFETIQKMKYMKAHSIVVRKNKTNPTLRDPLMFYPRIVGSLLDYIFKKYQYSMLCVFVDGTPPTKKGKSALIKSIKQEIKKRQPNKEFAMYFPHSSSNVYLQVSDYINWAILRKWESGDLRSYEYIKDLLGTPELDMFKRGDMEYYVFRDDPLI